MWHKSCFACRAGHVTEICLAAGEISGKGVKGKMAEYKQPITECTACAVCGACAARGAGFPLAFWALESLGLSLTVIGPYLVS